MFQVSETDTENVTNDLLLGPWLTEKMGKDGTYVLAIAGLGVILLGGLYPLVKDSPYAPIIIAAAVVQLGAIVLANRTKE